MIGPVVVPSPPVASGCPLTRRVNVPGSEGGATLFWTSTVPVQCGELAFAVTESPASVHVNAASPPKAVWKTPANVPDWNATGWLRSAGRGEKRLAAPIGMTTGTPDEFE